MIFSECHRNFKVFLTISVFSSLLIGCGSTPKAHNKEPRVSYEAPETVEEEGVSLGVSQDTKKEYFFKIAPEVMNNVCNGSPSSLKLAAASLRKSITENSEPEKVLLSVVTDTLAIAWPSERIEWEAPEVKTETPYTGAIKSAINGIYDESTGNVDFLTNLLPSLVVFRVNDVSDFFSKSEKDLSEALKIFPDSVIANYISGLLYYKHKDFDKSLKYFNQAYKNSPDCIQVIEKYASVLKETGKVREAYNFALENLNKFPSNLELLRLCAKSAFELELYDEAESYIARVLQQVPNDLESVLFRAKILVKSQNYIRAASLLDMYSRLDDSSKDYLLLRASVQYDWSKNTSGAVNTIEKAIKLYPEDLEVMLFASKLSNETYVTIDGKNGEYYANAVLAKDPENLLALEYAADGFVKNRNWDKAYEISKKIIKQKNLSSQRVLSHCNICVALKKADEAIQFVLPYYKENPSDENLIQAYLNVIMASGKNSEASSIIRDLSGTSSAKLKSYLFYKKSFLESTQEASLSDLRSSLISNPRNIDSLFRLYEIYYQKKDYRKAQYYLKQIVALNPNDARYKTLNDELVHLLK